MTALPWDRFTPHQVAEAPATVDPTPIYVPMPVQPVPAAPLPQPTALDWSDFLKDTVNEAVKENMATVKENTVDTVKETVKAVRAGESIDVQNPTVTATTAKGRELVVADARSRSWRTLMQGLMTDLFFAIIAVLGTVTQTDMPLDKTAWAVLGILLLKTAIQTAIAYFMRLRVTPTIRIPGEKVQVTTVPVINPP